MLVANAFTTKSIPTTPAIVAGCVYRPRCLSPLMDTSRIVRHAGEVLDVRHDGVAMLGACCETWLKGTIGIAGSPI